MHFYLSFRLILYILSHYYLFLYIPPMPVQPQVRYQMAVARGDQQAAFRWATAFSAGSSLPLADTASARSVLLPATFALLAATRNTNSGGVTGQSSSTVIHGVGAQARASLAQGIQTQRVWASESPLSALLTGGGTLPAASNIPLEVSFYLS